jgi:hypothetical protein
VLYYQGFQKIDFEHWEYANEKIYKRSKHLMKNRQYKDSHNHQTRTNLLLENFQQRLDATILETMQKKLLNLFEKALQNPSFGWSTFSQICLRWMIMCCLFMYCYKYEL